MEIGTPINEIKSKKVEIPKLWSPIENQHIGYVLINKVNFYFNSHYSFNYGKYPVWDSERADEDFKQLAEAMKNNQMFNSFFLYKDIGVSGFHFHCFVWTNRIVYSQLIKNIRHAHDQLEKIWNETCRVQNFDADDSQEEKIDEPDDGIGQFQQWFKKQAEKNEKKVHVHYDMIDEPNIWRMVGYFKKILPRKLQDLEETDGLDLLWKVLGKLKGMNRPRVVLNLGYDKFDLPDRRDYRYTQSLVSDEHIEQIEKISPRAKIGTRVILSLNNKAFCDHIENLFSYIKAWICDIEQFAFGTTVAHGLTVSYRNKLQKVETEVYFPKMAKQSLTLLCEYAKIRWFSIIGCDRKLSALWLLKCVIVKVGKMRGNYRSFNTHFGVKLFFFDRVVKIINHSSRKGAIGFHFPDPRSFTRKKIVSTPISSMEGLIRKQYREYEDKSVWAGRANEVRGHKKWLKIIKKNNAKYVRLFRIDLPKMDITEASNIGRMIRKELYDQKMKAYFHIKSCSYKNLSIVGYCSDGPYFKETVNLIFENLGMKIDVVTREFKDKKLLATSMFICMLPTHYSLIKTAPKLFPKNKPTKSFWLNFPVNIDLKG